MRIPMYQVVNDFPWYMACSDGYVINTDNGYVLRGSKKKTGYIEIILVDENGSPHYKLLHRVIAECFCEKPEGDNLEVNHINGNKTDNRADNLEWVTHGENLAHAYRTGLMPNNTTPKKVVAKSIESGEEMMFSSIYQAAQILNISKGNICLCCQGKRPYAGGYYWSYL